MSTKATYYRLERYPDVCRHCLKSDPDSMMISLETQDELFEGTLGEFIEAITFRTEKSKSHLYPQAICEQCLEMLKFFARFRSKILTIHRLMHAMVELKHSNMKPLKDLFEVRTESVNAIFRDLELCRRGGPKVSSLMADFRQYQIASLPNVLLTQPEKSQTPVNLDDTASVESDDELDAKPNCLNAETETNSEEPAEQHDPPELDEWLQCPKCHYHSTDPMLYEAHQRSHFRRETGTYPCKDCTETFVDLKSLKDHRSRTHKEHVCDVCGFRTSAKHKLLDHMKRHEATGEYRCEFCQKTFNVGKDRDIHVKRVHREQKAMWQCGICGLEFKRKYVLQDHELTHSNVFAHHCTQCNSKFKRPLGLKRHIQKVHNEKTRDCPYCERKYHEKYMLNDHIESFHGIQMRFFCDTCVEYFESQELLQVHQLRHASPKELECATCLVVFSSQQLLSEHLCITYRDDYVCCGEDFKFHKFYNNHMFIKHGTKTNVRVRMKPGQLFGAMRTKRKKTIKCPNCQKIFSSHAKKNLHVTHCKGKSSD